MNGLKIAVIGGGSSYTPELIEGLLKIGEDLPVSELWLADVEEGQYKLNIIRELSIRMINRSGHKMKIHTTLDRLKAIEGASFVITQIRVGQLDMRRFDEYIPIKHGMIGQETTGAGGFMKALRTIPVLLDICKDIENAAPNAWLLNFTNPAGVVTEAILKYSNVKVVGLCNNPINFYKKFAKSYGVKMEDVSLTFAGINHLSWITELYIKGESKLEEVLSGSIEFYEAQNIPIIGWDPDFLASLNAVPSGYHKYYYQTDKLLTQQIEEYKNNRTRADQVKNIERELFALYEDPELDEKPAVLSQRGGAYYSEAAVSLMHSIYHNTRAIHTLNVRNDGAIPGLPNEVCVEVNCVVEKHKVTPLKVQELSPQIRGLLQVVKAYEELTVEAGVSGDRGLALQALTIHPLVFTAEKANIVLEEMLEVNKRYLPQFN